MQFSPEDQKLIDDFRADMERLEAEKDEEGAQRIFESLPELPELKPGQTQALMIRRTPR